ncbi:MAG: hypothetical protein R3B39_02880 [Candidatus Paceibacterota bacterium]
MTFYADEPFGEVLWTSNVEYKGLSSFLPDASLLEGSPTVLFSSYWNDLVISPVVYGDMSYRDIATTFPVNQSFEAGQIFVVLELDDYSSIDHTPVFSTFVNCPGPWCENHIDPYEGGDMISDNIHSLFPHHNGYSVDLPFEVVLGGDISTSLPELKAELSIRIVDGVLLVPSDWAGSTLSVTDAIGRQVASFATLRGEEAIQLVRDQVVILTLILPRGERHTTKVFVQ